jgi:hypothetical protein
MSVRVRLCCKPVLGRQNFVKAVAQPGVGAKKQKKDERARGPNGLDVHGRT